MYRRRARLMALLAAALSAAALSGCVFFPQTGGLVRRNQTVERAGVETLSVELRMGGGELKLQGGADTLLEADFAYNVAEWEPIVEYDVNGDEGQLTIRQPAVDDITDLRLGDYVYEWDLRFAEDVPMAMDIQLGAGRSDLDVAEVTLTSLDVEVGAGQTTIYLNRDWTDDVDVSIRGGVGEAVIYLPAEVSVRIAVDGGIGQVETMGLTREGDVYVNQAYAGGDAVLEIEIDGGIGQINLEVVE
jgi:uncharacterized protein YciU (UPF0263 family)